MGLRLFGTLGATLEIVLLREVLRLDDRREEEGPGGAPEKRGWAPPPAGVPP